MSVLRPAPRRHALGLPAGSVRATHLLVITLILALVLLVRDRHGEPLPFPAYLVYLFFLMIGHYFATRGHSQSGERAPLYLPAGVIRLIVIAGLGAAVVYRFVTDYEGLERQLAASLEGLAQEPMLPLYLLGGFIIGAFVRSLAGRSNPSVWLQDLEAWISLIGLVGLGISAVIHLIIIPSMEPPRPDIARWDQIMAALVAFYFGARS